MSLSNSSISYICSSRSNYSSGVIKKFPKKARSRFVDQVAADYAEFREKFLARKKVEEKERDDLLRLHSKAVGQLEIRHANLMKAVEDGDYSAPIIAQLNKVDAELTQARAKRDAAATKPIFLPQDLPALYRAHIDDLVGTLSDESVSGPASEELHELIDTV